MGTISTRRVAVVGLGIISSLGNSAEEVADALRAGRTGIEFLPERKTQGFRSALAGTLKNVPEPDISKRFLNQMGFASRLAVPAVKQAVGSADLSETLLKDGRTGVIIGNSGGMSDVYDNVSQFHAGKKLGGNALQKTMNSSVSANLSVWLGTRGMCMTVATACASGATAIGMAYRAIKAGWQDRMLAGGVQEGSWQYDCNFDALRGFSQREDDPARASRPFDRDRDGLVPSAGAGMVVLEEYDSAVARGVPILAEVIGFATNSDGFDMVAPSGVGNRECMEFALADAGIKPGDVDYINAHATGTKVGDTAEAGSIAAIFGEGPLVSSTKGVTGHEIGAAGSNEFIYTLLMMRHGFAAPNVNLENIDDECRGVRYVGRQAQELAIETAVSNSFGFGGVNACLILKRSPS